MKVLKYLITTIIIIATLIFVCMKLNLIEFNVGRAKFEDKSKMTITNNSVYETIETFVGKEQFAKYNGKVIFFNSWATWCPTCLNEFPVLNSIFNSCAMDTNIAFLSYCSDLERISQIDSFKNKRGLQLNYDNVISKSGLRMSLRKIAVDHLKMNNIDTTSDAVPLNLIIDRTGNILYCKYAITDNDTNNILALLKDKENN